MNVAEQLREQNNGTSWRDCRDAGLQHQWIADVETTKATGRWWWTCQRCPVATVTQEKTPSRAHVGR